ncbi:APC family permease [Elongatibacter sediminis]|uniref:APC family permease n=1 Tax=Elongatibacter sediminis TaxID=3119006 RepID=A0AAW9R7S0_9GAMM
MALHEAEQQESADRQVTGPQPALRRDIRLSQLFTYSFGFLVGFGWIVLTGQWISTAGSAGAALAFLMGGLLLVPVGLCYVELATAFPYPGGEFVYAYHAFGKGVAFIAGWVLLFLFVSLTAFETVAAAWLVTVLIPPISGPPLYQVLGFEVTWGMAAIMLAGATFITAVNYRGSRVMARAQDFVTWILVLTTLIIIVCGLSLGQPANLDPLFDSSVDNWPLYGMLAIFITTPVWYSGINALPQALSELKSSPRPRTLSRLVTAMLVGSSIFYVLIIFAVGMSESRETLASADFATAFAIGRVLNSDWAVKLVLGAGLLGIVSTWNAAHFAASRVLYALSRAHLVSATFSRVHERNGCPHRAVLFVGAFGLLGASGGIPMIGAIVNSGVIVVSVLFVLTCASLFRVRRKLPSATAAYRVPGYPWVPLFGLCYAGCTVVFSLIVTWTSRTSGQIPAEWFALSIWFVLGLLLWLAAQQRRNAILETDRARLIRNEIATGAVATQPKPAVTAD